MPVLFRERVSLVNIVVNVAIIFSESVVSPIRIFIVTVSDFFKVLIQFGLNFWLESLFKL